MIEAILKLLTELGKYVNTKAEQKRAQEILDLKKELNEQLAKGQLSDDGEIERLEREIKLQEEALFNEILTKRA